MDDTLISALRKNLELPELAFDDVGILSLTFGDSISIQLRRDGSKYLRLVGLVAERMPENMERLLLELMLEEALETINGGVGIGLARESGALVTFQLLDLENNPDSCKEVFDFVQATEVWIRHFQANGERMHQPIVPREQQPSVDSHLLKL